MALIGVEEFAGYVGISTKKAYDLIHENMAGVYQVGSRYRIDLDEALAWLREEDEPEDNPEEDSEENGEEDSEENDDEED